jgi:adenine phosphoribosyltransferase
MFQDVTTLLLDPVAFKDSVALFKERYAAMNVQAIAGVNAFT